MTTAQHRAEGDYTIAYVPRLLYSFSLSPPFFPLLHAFTMKISDPLGKVYTHTMFKKRGGGGSSQEESREQRRSKNNNRHRELSEEEEEDDEVISQDEEEELDDDQEEEEEGSVAASDQSHDSLSTKSSRLAAGTSRENMIRQSGRGGGGRPLSTVGKRKFRFFRYFFREQSHFHN